MDVWIDGWDGEMHVDVGIDTGICLGGATLLKLCDESVCIQRPMLNHVNAKGNAKC